MSLPELASLIEKAKAIPMPELVKATKLPRQTLVDVLNGTSANPSIKTVTALSEGVHLLSPPSENPEEASHG